jgi:uncharacterized membrane protein
VSRPRVARSTRPIADLRGWEALAHGVFAIALTLLVLDIRVPDSTTIHSGAALVDALVAEMPRYIAYVLGFVVLGEYWIHVQRTMGWLRGVDHWSLVLGLAFLMVVATIPFPTALLAEYIGQGNGQEQVALAVFVGWQLVLAVLANVQIHYSARGGRLLKASVDPSSLRPWFIVAGLGVVIWLGALVAVFFVSGTVALVLIGAILVLFAFEMPVRPTAKAESETAEHAET